MFESGMTFWTAAMAIAIIVTAILAFREIQTRKNIERDNYVLQRKSICKKLLYEITQNEVNLKILQTFFNTNIDDFSKIQNYFKERNFNNLFKNSIYKKFNESNIDFKNDKIFENLYKLYSNIRHIDSVTSENFIQEPKDLELFLNYIKKEIKESLEKITDLYKLFKDEIKYNHKASDFYKDEQEYIELIKDLEIK